MTLTFSPVLNLGWTTPLHLDHLARELHGGDGAALQERLRERDDPALVVAHAVVVLGRQRLDMFAPLVDRDALRAHQHCQGIDPPLPVCVLMLATLHLARRQPAHVVMAARDHATHSDTGALAS